MKFDVTKCNVLVLGGLIIGAIAMVATGARAGQKNEYPIVVNGILLDPGTGVPVPATQISGQIGSVRATSDNKQYIGCYTTSTNKFTGNLGEAGCIARDASGATYSCTNTSADFRAAVRAINPQTFIQIRILGSVCFELYTENTSNLRTSAP